MPSSEFESAQGLDGEEAQTAEKLTFEERRIRMSWWIACEGHQ
jgi:hypothetical protein